MRKCMFFILLFMAAFVSFGEKVVTLPDLYSPYWVILDDSQIYICDRAEIKIYSLKDFSLKTKFGKEGEGPQEFKLTPAKEGLAVHPYKDYLLVSSIGKASFYSKEGKFIKELRTGDITTTAYYQTIGDGFACIGTTMGADISMVFTINYLDKNFKKEKEIYRAALMKQGSMTFPMVYPMFYVDKDKLLAPDDDSFSINIFDGDGKKIGTIKREYERLKVTDEYRKGVHHFFKTDRNSKDYYETFFKDKLKFHDYYPAIQFFYVDNGTVYIQTYLKEDGKYEYFIYDTDGKFLKRVFVPVQYSSIIRPYPMTFKNGAIYQLIENQDEEEWELHKVEIK